MQRGSTRYFSPSRSDSATEGRMTQDARIKTVKGR